ncbi:hypothetical protein [Actinomadura alba]|uniref:Uncharacterized protein n=1 Tax=Actinomadura alba TaxID=406431 RepID=A0ABR7LWU2_9ACTN|nr:hypothetical protein [Actinomadura alba]MBC6469324.1 hypothetical protein [Actinomadura alba]
MSTPDEIEGRFTLLTAAARYDKLRARDSLATPVDDDDLPLTPPDPDAVPLSRDEALELLALGEVIARKAGYGRQLSVRSARSAGASWSQIGAALGTSKQAAWEAHGRWIDDQAEQHRRSGYSGLDENEVAVVRAAAGEPEREDDDRAWGRMP